ncbi:M14 family zinc carboxypeptidase [Streptomyces longispororuber]|uniref:M14 family zinc carboxypeptidase n=1 Tax=Streptomyces longispororuber TaxID=68230 RepID=UPI001E3162E9|nr:M14 family zinc carboxypeptidase [Streptomyces longispororuber]
MRGGVAAGAVLVVVGAVLAVPSKGAARAAPAEVLRAERAVARPCFGRLLPEGAAGADRREVTARVDGIVQARLFPGRGRGGHRPGGDWDVAVFDRGTGRVVAASAAPRSRELAEGFVRRGQRLVVQGCRYGGAAREARLGLDFLAGAVGPSRAPGPAGPRASTPPQLVRVHAPGRADRDRLARLGFDVTGGGDARGLDVVLSGAAERTALARAGFTWRVVEPDLARRALRDARADRAYAARTATSPLPSGRTAYRHLYDYEYEMKELARRHPRLARAFTLPEPTREGRDVVALEIAAGVRRADDGRPVNLTLGLHHAREWPSGEVALEWAYDLLRRRGPVKGLVARVRSVVVPVVNPDGFAVSREAEPRGDHSRFDYEMKRKNCSLRDSPPAYATGVCKANPAGRERGTDPNRNYGGFWGGPGAGLDWNGDTYRGPAPFSEPEVRNVRALVSSRQVTNLTTLHTPAAVVLRPPGLADTRPPLDEPAYRALGDVLAARTGYPSRPSWQLYDNTGSTEDWSYWATGGWGFTVELAGPGFHGPYARSVVAEYAGLPPAPGAGRGGNRGALLAVLGHAADPATHATLTGRAPAGHRLALRKTFRTPTSPVLQPDGSTKPPLSVRDDLRSSLTAPGGRFRWAVNPSTRPYVAGRLGRDPQGPPQAGIAVVNPPGVPPVNEDYPADPAAESFTFRVAGPPEADNGRMAVAVSWGSPRTHWDLYVYDASGAPVASDTSGETSARAVLFDPPPGTYRAVLVNVAQADPAAVDDWRGRVDFASPVPTTYGEKEAYQLSCVSPRGRTVGITEVYAGRGETVDVGGICDVARVSSRSSPPKAR